MARQPDKSLVFLDGLRGLAALWVLLHHARWLLWEGWENFTRSAQEYSPAGRALAYVLVPLRYGHEAVLFFFVLSGFVFAFAYLAAIAARRVDGWTFAVRRFARLAPLAIATLLAVSLLQLIYRRQTGTTF